MDHFSENFKNFCNQNKIHSKDIRKHCKRFTEAPIQMKHTYITQCLMSASVPYSIHCYYIMAPIWIKTLFNIKYSQFKSKEL